MCSLRVLSWVLSLRPGLGYDRDDSVGIWAATHLGPKG